MPTYEYRCEQCQHQFEVFARMSDPAPEACEACGNGELVKVLFPVAVHYKGSGFYSTDYSGKKSATGGDSSSSSDTGSSSDSSDSTSGSPDSGGASKPDSGASATSSSSSDAS